MDVNKKGIISTPKKIFSLFWKGAKGGTDELNIPIQRLEADIHGACKCFTRINKCILFWARKLLWHYRLYDLESLEQKNRKRSDINYGK